MDVLLLIISDSNLRQLYHELLFSPSTEIVPIIDMGDALLFLTLHTYTAAIIYVDDDNGAEVCAFLQLRQKQISLLKTKIILLTSEKETFRPFLSERDRTVDIDSLNPGSIVGSIQEVIKRKR